MSKNIVIVLLALAALGALFYGYQQKITASEFQSACEKEKETLIATARQQQLEAKAFQELAAKAQQEAEVQRAICESLLNSKTK
ncbi:MAG: hypothetical protein KBF45_06430 [Cyclobacteriaceae bacterium]|jgi:uncharacterized protein HemX|nr:hypothetical protein [Cyclobacteriaceae bacterium]